MDLVLIDTASLQVACSRKIFGVRQWQDVLTAMPKSIQTVEMKFNFEAGNGWDDMSLRSYVNGRKPLRADTRRFSPRVKVSLRA